MPPKEKKIEYARAKIPLISEQEKLYSKLRQEYLSSEEFDNYFYKTLRDFYSQGIAIMSQIEPYKGDELINNAKKNSDDFLQYLREEKERKTKNYKESIENIKRLLLTYNHLVVASRMFIKQENPVLIEKIDILLDLFIEDKLDLQIVKAIKTLEEIWDLLV